MHVTAAILAGGRATRLGGRDKSAMIVDGATILERQIAALAQVTSDILIVGGDTTHERARTVPDLVPGHGPLGGLYTALHSTLKETQNKTLPETLTEPDGRVTAAVTVVVACDMPYISSRLIAYIASLAADADADAVVPRTERGWHPQLHPLCAAYTQRCLVPIARRLADRQLRMTDLLDELLADRGLRVVTTRELERFGDPHRLLANVNTPVEYDRLEAALPGHNFDTQKSQEL